MCLNFTLYKVILLIKTLIQEAPHLTRRFSTRASNKRKQFTNKTDKRMYKYTYKLTIKTGKHMSIAVS